MNLANFKSRFLFAVGTVSVVAFAVIFLSGLLAAPANAATDGWHIKDDATGGECSTIGNWNVGSKTCTLSQDLSQGIIIDSNYIILDGNGRTITGSNTGTGVYLYGRAGVTIKNLNVQKFTFGIYLRLSNGNTLTNNTANSNATGITITDFSDSNTLTNNTANLNGYGITIVSSFNTLTNNTANLNDYGISLTGGLCRDRNGIWVRCKSFYNTLTSNTTSLNYIGIFLEHSNSNTLTGNTVGPSRFSNGYGIKLNSSSNSKVYNNNLLDNNTQIQSNDGANNIYNLPAPVGGNYLSNYDTSQEGCADADSDNFCDTPYIFSGGQDNLPWTKKDGWLVPPNQPPTLSYSQEGGYVDDGINPDEGDTNTNFTFKIVYTDTDNDPPTDIRTVIFDGSPSDSPAIEVFSDAMVLDSSTNLELRDGNYTNGEQYTLTKSFPAGTYRYRFQASDGEIGTILDGVAGGTAQGFIVSESLIVWQWFVPTETKMGNNYDIVLKISNHSNIPRTVNFSLKEKNRELGKEPCYPELPPEEGCWDLNYQQNISLDDGQYLAGTAVTDEIPPNTTISHTFTINEKWNWIEPWNPDRFYSRLISFAPITGDIFSIANFTLTLFSSVGSITHTYEGTVATQVEPFSIETVVPTSKALLLAGSVLAGIPASEFTIKGVAALLPPFTLGGVGLLAAQVGLIGGSEKLYAMAADPQEQFTEINYPSPVKIPESCGIKDENLVLTEESMKLLASLKGLADAYISYDAAEDAGAYEWMAIHRDLIKKYTLLTEVGLANIKVSTEPAISSVGNLSQSQLEKIKQVIRQGGLPDAEVCLFEALGYTTEQIIGVKNWVLSSLDNYVPVNTSEMLNSLAISISTALEEVPPLPEQATVAEIDIEPNTLNTKSERNWIAVHIELPANYKPEEIDCWTIRISNNLSSESCDKPVSSMIGDYNKNGVPDMTIKFSRSSTFKILKNGINILPITGSLVDGTVFGGSDEIRVIAPGKK